MKRVLKYFDAATANISAEINLPSSKSIANRLLIIRFLTRGKKDEIINLSDAADTLLLEKILKSVRTGEENVFDVRNAGTVMRFLTAVFSITRGSFMLNCDERMKQRPIAELVNALRSIGAEIRYIESEGYPPLLINGGDELAGEVSIDASQSSQFVSALLLIAPLLSGGLTIRLKEKPVSKPYIDMTMSLMRRYGIDVKEDFDSIRVEPGNYNFKETAVEADWSSAAFFYEAVALSHNGSVFLKGLTDSGLQGDSVVSGLFDYLGVSSIFEKNGVRITKTSSADKNIRVDFSDHPDIAMPFIVACAGLGVIGTFTGLDNLKIKESDRLKALINGLAAFGYDFRETGFGEWVLINSCRVGEEATVLSPDIEVVTNGDHRVAMAFAPLVFLSETLIIDDDAVVDKSFPRFWNEFGKLTGQ